ncbi:hypothetical protein AK88_00414 [Plasmodium fragile]|uniref:FMR1-interacting protein 1 conserved domain-containing protein n=1 Tax=Plasmodium fragile TaxID=5857 RepID=A0A0D9QSL4_PLAFR|nr:uncharacterized protein AK88_00414 [Plasmodium fragile]KJP89958.1 hypothetical protein AK88_00414 [Plasmodium fragile]
MSQDARLNNYEGHFRGANNYGKFCNREESQNMIPRVSGRGVPGVHYGGNRAVREQGDVWCGADEGAVQNGPGQNRSGQGRQTPNWASTPCGHSPNWPMQNGGASYWRQRGSPHNNRIGRRPWNQAPGAQRQHWTSNNRWRDHHTEGCQREQPAHGPLTPDGNYLKNYFSSYGNGYAENGNGNGSCEYQYGGAPEQASEREIAHPHNGGRGGPPRTVRSSAHSRTTVPPPRSAYAQRRAMYNNGFPQMDSINGDNQDMEDPYQASTNVVDNANREDDNHWMKHTMENSYESINFPHGEIPQMGGSYNFRQSNNGVGFPPTSSFVAPLHSNRAVRGMTHWKKSPEERYAQHCSSVKKHGGKKRQKMDFFSNVSELKQMETNPKERNKTDENDHDDRDGGDDDEDEDGDGVGPKGINLQMKKSKENGKFIFCHYCDVNIEAEKMEEHKQSEHIKCPIDNCVQIYSIDDLDVHLLNHIKNDNDEVILNDSKEIEKWIQERKKNYPTREKIAINMKNHENGKKKKKKKTKLSN